MKYIRTKDAILPYYKDSKTGKLTVVMKVVGEVFSDKVDEVFNQIVINHADTIEELCDEFVGVDKTNEHDRLSKLSLKSYCNYVAIYGAIWTDKGLIYVAKMNEKGELELL